METKFLKIFPLVALSFLPASAHAQAELRFNYWVNEGKGFAIEARNCKLKSGEDAAAAARPTADVCSGESPQSLTNSYSCQFRGLICDLEAKFTKGTDGYSRDPSPQDPTLEYIGVVIPVISCPIPNSLGLNHLDAEKYCAAMPLETCIKNNIGTGGGQANGVVRDVEDKRIRSGYKAQ